MLAIPLTSLALVCKNIVVMTLTFTFTLCLLLVTGGADRTSFRFYYLLIYKSLYIYITICHIIYNIATYIYYFIISKLYLNIFCDRNCCAVYMYIIDLLLIRLRISFFLNEC